MATHHAPRISRPIVSIGAGNMASAILRGAATRGVVQPDHVTIADPDSDCRAAFRDWGAEAFGSADEALASVGGEGVVLLAVKPQMLPEVAASLPKGVAGRLVVSILAGVPLAGVSDALQAKGRVIRAMPNTPAQVGRGVTALCSGHGVNVADASVARSLFDAVGDTLSLEESMMDAFTGVAGSGPAYLFYLVESMAAGAESVGFARDQAARIARATVVGASALLAESDRSARELRASVTSKNGTTFAATETLDAERVREAFVAAIEAARDRGRELGR